VTATIAEQRTRLYSQLWAVADELRGRMDASNFKNYMLSIIFYRDLSERTAREAALFLENEDSSLQSYSAAWKNLDLRDELSGYLLGKLGYVIEPANLYSELVREAKLGANGGWHIDRLSEAFNSLSNSTIGAASQESFEGLFSSIDLNSPSLGKTLKDKTELMGRIVLRIASIDFHSSDVEIDLLGDAYEYLIGKFASDAGKKGGEFYTPQEVATLLARIVASLRPDLENVYDPTCGSGSLLFRVVRERAKDEALATQLINIEGQELNIETFNLARMNLILHDVPWQNFDVQNGDTLAEDLHEGKTYDSIVANPPYSTNWSRSDAKATLQDPRFSPAGALAPPSKADMAFVQHIVHHMAEDGVAAIVLPVGILYRGAAEAKIRRWLVEQNLVDAIIGLPGGIFNAGVTTFVLVLKKGRKKKAKIRFIDASEGFLKTKQLNIVTQDSIDSILKHYVPSEKHPKGKDKDGYSKRVSREEIAANDYGLQINLYVKKANSSSLPSYADMEQSLSDNNSRIQLAKNKIEELNVGYDGIRQLLPANSPTVRLGDVLAVEKDTIGWHVSNSEREYGSQYSIPVLTANKQFVLGYMADDPQRTYRASKEEPVIIFDQFTTASRWVDFPFRGKSAVLCVLKAKTDDSLKFLYYALQALDYDSSTHQQHWNMMSKLQIPLPSLAVQQKIVDVLDAHGELAKLEEERLQLLKIQSAVVLESVFDR
jgi:type I restriction enzyme M protein